MSHKWFQVDNNSINCWKLLHTTPGGKQFNKAHSVRVVVIYCDGPGSKNFDLGWIIFLLLGLHWAESATSRSWKFPIFYLCVKKNLLGRVEKYPGQSQVSFLFTADHLNPPAQPTADDESVKMHFEEEAY